MKILLTGGAGYIGTELVERLHQNEDVEKIYIYDNLSRPGINFFMGKQTLEKVEFIKGDILDGYTLEKALQKVDKIYHLAAYVSFPYNYTQNVQYEQVNHWGTLNLVRALENVEHEVDQLIYLSSTSVYGLKENIDLDGPPAPTNAYGQSKWEGEKCVRLLQDQMEVNILRSANVFGYNRCLRNDSVLNDFIMNGWIEGKILIYGDGTQNRSFVSLPRLVDQLESLCHKGAKETITHAVDFNANVNELRDWLKQEKLPELEYVNLNQNIQYEGQSFRGLDPIEQHYEQLNEVFDHFVENIVVSA